MPSALLCLIAKGVIRDADTNNLSVFNILEQVGAQGFPLLIQEAAVLAVWRRAQDEGQQFAFDFALRNNDRVIIARRIDVNFAGAELNRTIIRLGGILAQEPGVLVAQFAHNGQVVASYQIHLRVDPTLQVQPAAPA